MNSGLISSAEAGVEIARQESADFEQLFATQWPRLVRILHRMTGNRSQAEDIVQETFLRFHKRRHALQSPAAWLYRVALRLGLDALRGDRRRGRWEQTAFASAHASSTPDTQVQVAEQQELVSRVLGRMSKRSAQLLLLRYSGLSFAEIAEITGLKVSSVGTLLNRAELDFKKRYLKLSRGARP
jgi:RNA polymerase sigma factor (sigma-70 family)